MIVFAVHLSFVYDEYKLIEERNALDNHAAVRKYVWQPESLDRDVPLTVYDAATDSTYFYHADANKNVTELTDANGNVVAHYEYSPFGTVTNSTGSFAAANPFRFSSEYFDEETGLVYYNYRYYDPQLGRWISRDPIEEQGGYNLYAMIGNNPMWGWDELGLTIRVYYGPSGAKTGHIAVVVGNKKMGYTYFSFAPNGLETKKNKDFRQLEREIQKSRGKYPYTHYADYDTNEVQDKKAIDAAKKYATEKYYRGGDSKVCIHLVADVVNAASPSYNFVSNITPWITYLSNRNTANKFGKLE